MTAEYRMTGDGLVAPWCPTQNKCLRDGAIGRVSPYGDEWNPKHEGWAFISPATFPEVFKTQREARDYVVRSHDKAIRTMIKKALNVTNI